MTTITLHDTLQQQTVSYVRLAITNKSSDNAIGTDYEAHRKVRGELSGNVTLEGNGYVTIRTGNR